VATNDQLTDSLTERLLRVSTSSERQQAQREEATQPQSYNQHEDTNSSIIEDEGPSAESSRYFSEYDEELEISDSSGDDDDGEADAEDAAVLETSMDTDLEIEGSEGAEGYEMEFDADSVADVDADVLVNVDAAVKTAHPSLQGRDQTDGGVDTSGIVRGDLDMPSDHGIVHGSAEEDPSVSEYGDGNKGNRDDASAYSDAVIESNVSTEANATDPGYVFAAKTDPSAVEATVAHVNEDQRPDVVNTVQNKETPVAEWNAAAAVAAAATKIGSSSSIRDSETLATWNPQSHEDASAEDNNDTEETGAVDKGAEVNRAADPNGENGYPAVIINAATATASAGAVDLQFQSQHDANGTVTKNGSKGSITMSNTNREDVVSNKERRNLLTAISLVPKIEAAEINGHGDSENRVIERIGEDDDKGQEIIAKKKGGISILSRFKR
jgi:hypothetical protein